ncbi:MULTISPECIES: hypothetical protein [unclassified Curtobacterium]|uniref:hypothetical protein n=1 Tax=unclassified Curtobacterium TaxID=257496 RepID=UPI0008DD8377|nr:MULTISPECIES: hypothetical protein [unclassified Curtobacterium]OIH92900.1 hypothetical protein BIU92_08335 [Curtobacterium sp. MCBA15_003]OII29813.1 hypothetical protein BIU94_09075 [Curtobacterium sp. MMLR14_006]
MSTREQHVGSGTAEAFADRLQRLRRAAGDPSYGDVAARITARRVAVGTPEAAARIARSTVYDVFRPGRTRLNVSLVGEVVRVLGVADGDVEEWQRAARSPVVARPGPGPAGPVRPEVGPAPSAQSEADERPTGRPGSARLTSSASAVVASSLRRWPDRFRHDLDAGSVVLLVAAAVGLDLFGASVSEQFHLPIWLDTIGTAVIALRLGPWAGAGVGAGAVLLNQLAHGPTSFWFALVGVVAGLLWGAGGRLRGLQRSSWRLLVLGLVVAVGCTAVATPVTVLAYQASVTHGTQAYIDLLSAAGDGPWVAVALANLGASVLDKVLTTFVAFALLVLLERRMTRAQGTPLPD